MQTLRNRVWVGRFRCEGGSVVCYSGIEIGRAACPKQPWKQHQPMWLAAVQDAAAWDKQPYHIIERNASRFRMSLRFCFSSET